MLETNTYCLFLFNFKPPRTPQSDSRHPKRRKIVPKMTFTKGLGCILFACSVTTVVGDVYFHNPRGSNNRLDERVRQSEHPVLRATNPCLHNAATNADILHHPSFNLCLFSICFFLQGRERANANRMFDSQNNNRGGMNVGSVRSLFCLRSLSLNAQILCFVPSLLYSPPHTHNHTHLNIDIFTDVLLRRLQLAN